MNYPIHEGSGRQSALSRGFGAVGTVVPATALVAAAGPLGVVFLFLVGGMWYFTFPLMAFAVGQLVFVALMSERALALFLLGQGGLAMLLVASLVDDAYSLRAIMALLTSGMVLGAVTWLGVRTGHLWIGAVVLLAGGLAIGYLIHRYERVRLGLVKSS